jgi:hypothetical protein
VIGEMISATVADAARASLDKEIGQLRAKGRLEAGQWRCRPVRIEISTVIFNRGRPIARPLNWTVGGLRLLLLLHVPGVTLVLCMEGDER